MIISLQHNVFFLLNYNREACLVILLNIADVLDDNLAVILIFAILELCIIQYSINCNKHKCKLPHASGGTHMVSA